MGVAVVVSVTPPALCRSLDGSADGPLPAVPGWAMAIVSSRNSKRKSEVVDWHGRSVQPTIFGHSHPRDGRLDAGRNHRRNRDPPRRLSMSPRLIPRIWVCRCRTVDIYRGGRGGNRSVIQGAPWDTGLHAACRLASGWATMLITDRPRTGNINRIFRGPGASNVRGSSLAGVGGDFEGAGVRRADAEQKKITPTPDR